MLNKYYKKFKKEQLQNIKQNFKYIYIFRYNNLNIDENIFLKKELKKLNFNFLILKQKLIQDEVFVKIKGQGALLLIYGNNHNFNKKLFEKKVNFKNLNLIFFLNENKIFSNLKLNKIFFKKKVLLNKALVQPLFKFLFCLIKIKEANIT
uniref:Ymf98 n=1 Tax=Paralagenidium karlingii TaxID=1440115 RepID=UPI0026E379E0|nr:Ymf98 [Paralagenidium karlingii]WJH17911.1 Ymf98 [Paralagenidium karlingii]